MACPDEAETWMRQVDRAIKINQWTIEEAFQQVQAKLMGTTIVWYQNREEIFDKHPEGLDVRWQTFWLTFEHKYVARNDQAL